MKGWQVLCICSNKGLFRECCGLLDCLPWWYLNRRGAACCALLGVRGLAGQGKPCPYEERDHLHTVRQYPTRLQPCRRVSGVERTPPGYPL